MKKKKPSLIFEQLEERIFLDANPLVILDSGVDPGGDAGLEPLDAVLQSAAETAAATSAEPAEKTAGTAQSLPDSNNSGNEQTDPGGDIVQDGLLSAGPDSDSDVPEPPATAAEAAIPLNETIDPDDAFFAEPVSDQNNASGADGAAQALPDDATEVEEAAALNADPTEPADGTPASDRTDPTSPATIIINGEEVALIDPMIGEDFTFTVSFDNTTGQTAFGPYIDIYFPTSGVDNDDEGEKLDGIEFVSATYEGRPVDFVISTFDASGQLIHPFAKNSSGPITINGNTLSPVYEQYDTMVTLVLPFGSFTPQQPAADIAITAHLSDYADVPEPLTTTVSSGFMFGQDPLNNPSTDPSIIDLNVTQTAWLPEVIAFQKTYNGPEGETATGPNFARSYTIAVDVAANQTVDNLKIVDDLPDNIVFIDGSVTGNFDSYNWDGDILTIDLGSVTGQAGGGDASVTFAFYVGDVLNDCGVFEEVVNDMQLEADWVPSDPRDDPQHIIVDAEVDANGTIGDPARDEVFQAQSIAVQKAVSPGPYAPGDFVTYTLEFQVSDYYAFGQLEVEDLLPDGTNFQDSSATFSITEQGIVYNGSFTPGGDLQINRGLNDTQLLFDISAALGGQGDDGVLEGGLFETGGVNLGAATGTITYTVQIDKLYNDNRTPVTQGDILPNTVSFEGRSYVPNPRGFPALMPSNCPTMEDGSEASISFPTGSVDKSVYAIDGVVTSGPGPENVQPGSAVTYRLTYTLPLGDFQNMVLLDYLPLPIFDATDPNLDGTPNTWITAFTAGDINGDIPEVGHIKFGPDETFFNIDQKTPDVSTIGAQNALQFLWDDNGYINPDQNEVVVDLLFTVLVSDQPFTDQLRLTNQVWSAEQSSQGNINTDSDIEQVILDEPEVGLASSKGVVDVSEADGTYGTFVNNVEVDTYFSEPGSTDFRFTANGGVLDSTWLNANDIDTDLLDVDAGDIVTFALVFQNSGNFGTYDVRFKDTLPDGFTTPAGGLNLQVTTGAGTRLNYIELDGALGQGLFGEGLEIVDSGGLPSIGPTDPSSGADILLVTYDLVLTVAVQPLQEIVNTATLFSIAASEGGPNFIGDPPSDTGSVTIVAPEADKDFAIRHLGGTSYTDQPHTTGSNVAIGEVVSYEVVITVQEGTTPGVTFIDLLDSGLAFMDLKDLTPEYSASITASAGLTATNGAFQVILDAAVVDQNGQRLTLDFGDVINSDTDNATPETITIVYSTVVLNTNENIEGKQLNNKAQWTWDSEVVQDQAPKVTVREPEFTIDKKVQDSDGSLVDTATGLDLGDAVSYEITVRHDASTITGFDVTFADILPASGIDWTGASATVTAGITPDVFSGIAAGTISATWDEFGSGEFTTFLISGGVMTGTFAGQSIINTGAIEWTSLPGDPGEISPNSAKAYERTGDPTDPGLRNNYNDTDAARITVTGAIDKVNDGTYTIGETHIFKITVNLPEGDTQNLVVTDELPLGLAYVDGDFSVDWTGFNGDQVPVDDTITASGDITFTFAGPLSLPADSTNNAIVISLKVLVDDLAQNYDGVEWTNHAFMEYGPDTNNPVRIDDPTDPVVDIIEPQITTTKSVDAGGDTIADALYQELEYTVTFTNTGRSTAYDVYAEDLIAQGTKFLALISSPTGIQATPSGDIVTFSSTDNTSMDIDPDETITLTYTVQVLAAWFRPGIHTNVVDADWYSLDNQSGRTYDDGITPPGSPVDGSQDTASAQFTVPVGDGRLGDRVWLDFNANGVFDAGSEAGIPGVQLEGSVTIDNGIDPPETFTAIAITDAEGFYEFNNLPDTVDYSIKVLTATLPNGVYPTYDYDSGLVNPDNTADYIFGVDPPLPFLDLDFGYRGDGTIGDRVWFDLNNDGVQDAGELGLDGVTVILEGDLDSDGTYDPITSIATTNNGTDDGWYEFGFLPFVDYRISVDTTTLPYGLTKPSFDFDGGFDNLAEITLQAAGDGGPQETEEIDFGYVGNGLVGNFIWDDYNADGKQNSGEPGFDGVEITLQGDLDKDGTYDFSKTVTTTATADPFANYLFTDLPEADYLLTVDYSFLPADYIQSWDPDGRVGMDNTTEFTLSEGDRTYLDRDFGYTETGSLGDFIWFDVNGNGLQDSYDSDGNGTPDTVEPGFVGVTVTLVGDKNLDGDLETITATTDASGTYLFDDLPAGSYTITVDKATLPLLGMVQTADPDLIPDSRTTYLLSNGEDNLDLDFGYTGGGSLGNRVWYDQTNLGIQDGEADPVGTLNREPGFEDVAVKLTYDLYTGGPTITLQTTTGADGIYEFTRLPAATYTISIIDPAVDLPAGLTPSYDLDGIDGIGAGTDHTTQATLGALENKTDVDFGYTGTGTIGDRVWYDLPILGDQEPGEPGFENVTVQLELDIDQDGTTDYTTTVETRVNTITGVDGFYEFTNLLAGTYTITILEPDVDLPAGLIPSFDFDGIGAGTDHTADVILGASQTIDRVDFGYTGTGSIGDRVWYDANNDGVQDGLTDASGTLDREPGFQTYEVRLELDFDNDGTIDYSTFTETGLDGIYGFTNLLAGTYTVYMGNPKVDDALAQGLKPSYDLDSGINNPDLTTQVTLAAGQDRDDVDFGYTGTGSIGDRVWYDANNDGVQDGLNTPIFNLTREPGLANVTVQLELDVPGFFSYVTAVDTGADGIYTFSNLPFVPGDFPGGPPNGIYYIITIIDEDLPSGMTPSYDLDGIAGGIGAGTDHTTKVSLDPGQDRVDVDFGYTGIGSLGDRVWFDQNLDGIQDGLSDPLDTPGREPGIPQAEIFLFVDLDGDSIPDYIASTTTGDQANDGQYLFENLAFVSHTLLVNPFSLIAAARFPTYDLDGTADHRTTVVLGPGGTSNLLPGLQNPTNVDFGYAGSGRIGNFIWDDSNANGVWDAGEQGISGVKVTLEADVDNDGVIDFTDVRITQATTDPQENYLFDALPTATYTIIVDPSTLPANYIQSADPDGRANMDNMSQVVLTRAYQEDLDQDFGYTETGSIGDYIWYDANADTNQDRNEPGLAGVTVTLRGDVDLDGQTDTLTATTNAQGFYLFDAIPAGPHTITVASATLPGGMRPTYDLDGNLDNRTTYQLQSGENTRGVDFGYTGTGSIGDTIWQDSDFNKIQDGGEPGIPGVVIELSGDFDGDGAADYTTTATTDASGRYLFANLPAGTYSLVLDRATIPPQFQQSFDPDGVLDSMTVLTLGAGENNLDQDFGYAVPLRPVTKPPGPPEPPIVPPITTPDPDDPGLRYQFADSAADLMVFPVTGAEQDLQPPVPISPIYTGIAEPGTTLTLIILDGEGNRVAYQTVIADQSGNWLGAFTGSLLLDTVHQTEIHQSGSSIDNSTPGSYNLRTYYNPTMVSLAFSTTGLDTGAIFAGTAENVLRSIHQWNNSLLNLDWDKFTGYEFFSPSINPAKNTR